MKAASGKEAENKSMESRNSLAGARSEAITSTAKHRAPVQAYVAGVWIILVLGAFPLILHDGYADILEVKYAMFAGLCAVMAFIMLCVRAAGPRKREAGKKTVRGIKAIWRKLSLTDRGVLLFFIISVVSTIQASPYVSQAFYGNEGRYNGLILNTAYTVFYFMISRNLKCRQEYLYVFLASGLLVCLFGITDFFLMDLFYLHYGQPGDTFMSTIGNINSFTVFCGLAVAVSGALYIFAECGVILRLIFLAVYAICLEAMLMGNSDNTYLFLGAVYATAPFAALKRKSSTCRYAAAVSMFVTCIWALIFISERYARETIPIDSVLKLIGDSRIAAAAAAGAWILTAVISITTGRWAAIRQSREGGTGTECDPEGTEQPKRQESPELRERKTKSVPQEQRLRDQMPERSVRIWAAFVGLCAAAMTGVVIWANANAELVAARWPQLTGYLIFNDEWGTFRGYVWRAAFEEYACLAPIHQIFGTGPDTFGIYMVTLRYQDMVRNTGFYYDSAHSEYIELLFTLGPIGLAAHIAMIAGNIRRCLARISGAAGRHRGVLAASSLAVAGYAAQAMININVPIVAPIFWAMLAIGESALRSADGRVGTGVTKEAAELTRAR